MTHKVYTLLGFAQKAGKIVSGEAGCENAIKQNKVFLLIVSDDASDHTKSRMRSLTDFFQTEFVQWGSKTQIGISIGKSPRATVGVLDKHFAEEIGKLITQAV